MMLFALDIGPQLECLLEFRFEHVVHGHIDMTCKTNRREKKAYGLRGFKPSDAKTDL
jgi:hypothetical protein